MAAQKQLPNKESRGNLHLPKSKNSRGIKRNYIFPAIVFITCFILYGNTISNGYALDDGIYINKNDFIIKGFSAFKDIFDKGSLYGFDKNPAAQYRPITLLNFMAEVSIFGLNPHVSHFFNILFYAFTVVLLYVFLQYILKKYNPSVIIASTLLFAFHPIHTEVVANIKSRDEIVGLLFGLASFYFIILHQEKNKNKYYFLSLASFSASIYCKESCLSFAGVIPLLLYFFTSLEPRKIIAKTIPYLALVCIYIFIRNHILQSFTFIHPIPIMDNALMAARNAGEMTATSFVLLGRYIYMVIIPYPLSWDYSYNQIPIVSWESGMALVSVLVCICLIGYSVWGFKKKSIYSFLILFFFISLLLSSNLVIKIASTFGERFLYAPSLSFCIALPILLYNSFHLLPIRFAKKNNNYFQPAILGILIIYTVIVIHRNNDWKNNFTLFSSGIITSPNSARAHLSLAQEYGEELKQPLNSDEKQKAYNLDVEESYKALSIFNNYPEAYYNLGVLYVSAGMKDSAGIMFQKTLAIKPGNAAAANNLGIIYGQKGDYENALKWFNNALLSDSTIPGVYLNLGTIYQYRGDIGKTEYYYRRGLSANADNEDIKHNLFIMYYNSGKEFFNKNEYAEALKEFILSNKYNSQSAEVTGYLGAIYQAESNFSKAEEYYRKSLEINPENVSVRENLNEVMMRQKKG
jgi:protein O-mannosyl-transferase